MAGKIPEYMKRGCTVTESEFSMLAKNVCSNVEPDGQYKLDFPKEKADGRKKTIVVNLFAGPGAGKSTGACYVFSRLKMIGLDCEYVSEFAKDKVWEHNEEVLKCQFYISGKQAYKISRVYGKVDVIITDSPILLGALYGEETSPKLKEAIKEEFGKYYNLNFFINRVKEYNPNGRMQTLDEAKAIDDRMKEMLASYGKDSYMSVDGSAEGYEMIIERVAEELMRIRNDY